MSRHFVQYFARPSAFVICLFAMTRAAAISSGEHDQVVTRIRAVLRTQEAAWNRGAYLVATIGRCSDCHTPRNWLGAPEPARLLAGTSSGPGGKAVPNITPDSETGIGKWSAEDIVTLLRDGHTPDFDFIGGAMAEIVRNTSRLTDADRRAIALYLRSLPAIHFRGGAKK